MTTAQPSWTVLLIGGSAGSGSEHAAAAIGRRYGLSWLQMDDVRYAMQESRSALPEGDAALYFFLAHDVWRLPPPRLRDAHVAAGAALTPAVKALIERHVAHRRPIIIEGDSILPMLWMDPAIQRAAAGGRVEAVYVYEDDEYAIHTAMRSSDPEFTTRPEPEQRAAVRASAMYGRWLAGQAQAHGLPVVPARPLPTLADRVLGVTGAARVRR